MKVLITGGGTGGHINPALAIAQKVRSSDQGNQVLYVGTKNSLESELVPKAGFEFKTVTAKFLRRKISVENIKTVFASAKGVMEARRIIREFKPDVVVGTGGYVCGPVVLAAALLHVPTMIHEQNVFPGITNKMLAKVVDTIAISFEDARKYFPPKYENKLILVGNPVRREVLEADRSTARKKFGLKSTDVFIYSFGGSGGQISLNEAMVGFIGHYCGRQGVRILHVTGKKWKEDFEKSLADNNIHPADNIEICDYMYNAPDALAASDIVIGSSGAITIAEITVAGVPSIMIPKTYTAEHHQEYNARAMEKEGAAKVILERELSSQSLIDAAEDIMKDKSVLKSMALNSKRLGRRDVEDKIYGLITALAKRGI